MKRYDEYKQTGKPWIGEIPSHWEVMPIKFTAKIYNGDSLNDNQKSIYGNCNDVDSIPYIASKDVGRDSKFVDYENGIRIPEGGKGFSVARPNTTLLCIEGGSAGKKTAYVNQRVCFVNKLCCFDSKLFDKYNYYFICSNTFKDPFSKNLQGMIGGVTISEIKKFPIIVPPLNEQEAIAAYLDKKCESIDTVISTQERRIALLEELKQSVITEAVTHGINPDAKLRPSGIDWIGNIPEHWEVMPLKYVLKVPLMYGANESADSDNESNPRYIRITDIDDDGKLKVDTICRLSRQKAESYLLKKNDILFARSGATVGKTYLHINDEYACFAGYLIKAECNEKIVNPFFVYNYTKSKNYSNWKDSINIQATIQNIGADKYSVLSIPVPPLREQEEIVEYIDRKIKPIDASIAKAKREIELLKELKQSVITEAVTGKIKIF